MLCESVVALHGDVMRNFMLPWKCCTSRRCHEEGTLWCPGSVALHGDAMRKKLYVALEVRHFAAIPWWRNFMLPWKCCLSSDAMRKNLLYAAMEVLPWRRYHEEGTLCCPGSAALRRCHEKGTLCCSGPQFVSESSWSLLCGPQLIRRAA